MVDIRVTAIVPAYNEEETVAEALKPLFLCEQIDEVIVIDDGSEDKTAQISKRIGAKVVELKENKGKGEAMKEGLRETDAEIILFSDADLRGLTSEYFSALIDPILKKRAVMSTGVRERFWNLPLFFIKIDPLLAIGGVRALRRFVFGRVPLKFIEGFGVETALNYYCKIKKLPVCYIPLKGIKQVIKEKKRKWFYGFWARIKMIGQILKTRVQLMIHKEEFKNL